jgi:prolyl 4-hydroxylase
MSSARIQAAEHDAAGRHEDAVNVLAGAAGRGDVEAMADLGTRLLIGDRALYLPRDAAGLLFDAARAGHAEAALRCACLTALGAHVQQSWGGALGLLAYAAGLGSPSARDQLRVLARQAEAPPEQDWQALARSIDLAGWLTPPVGVRLHDEPLVRHFPAFLEPVLCDWLIEKAGVRLRPAMIYSGEAETVDEMRTNSVGVWHLGCMDLINVVQQYRIAAACRAPIANLEAPTALRYHVGEQITNHYDYLNPKRPNHEAEVAAYGERVITFLTYLNDDYEGGETDFPIMKLRHRGKRGDGLFFANALPSTKPDDRSVHAGLPPTRGEKWLTCQFVRSKAIWNTPAENGA